jgi:hypothetical protein
MLSTGNFAFSQQKWPLCGRALTTDVELSRVGVLSANGVLGDALVLPLVRLLTLLDVQRTWGPMLQNPSSFALLSTGNKMSMQMCTRAESGS